MTEITENAERKVPLYEEVANRITYLIEEKTFRPGLSQVVHAGASPRRQDHRLIGAICRGYHPSS